MSLYFSRLVLARTPAVRVIEHTIRNPDQGVRLSAQHNLIWAAFTRSETDQRAFLFREEPDGSFLTLSTKPPREDCELFQRPEVRPFDPKLKQGDVLQFALRANATMTKRITGERVDVVADVIRHLPKEERAGQRHQIAQEEGQKWLCRQGQDRGFRVDGCAVTNYRLLTVQRFSNSRKHTPRIGVMDMEGVLVVKDPALFVQEVAKGIGRAKAFGCGLMLCRKPG